MRCCRTLLVASWVALSTMIARGAELDRVDVDSSLHGSSQVDSVYQFVLRSRRAEAAPTRTKDSQTGGGSILVEQPEPNTIVVTMGGSAVAGSEFHGSSAGIHFNLDQELEIVPTRAGLRPPRVGIVARVVGTLQVSNKGHCKQPCGSADQGPATASLISAETSVVSVACEPVGVMTGQELAINHRTGPEEVQAAAGIYHLVASFQLGVAQGKAVFNRQSAVADFDPAPQLDPFWVDALKPFRAVPRQDFGFKLVLRVVEDPSAEIVAPRESVEPSARRNAPSGVIPLNGVSYPGSASLFR